MKRGFLLKAADKKKGAAKTNDRKHQPPKPKETQINPPDNTSNLNPQLPIFRDNNLSKNLPDYPSFNENFVSSAKTDLYKTVPHILDGDGTTEWIIRDQKVEAQVMNAPNYPARVLQPRRPDFYEIRMTPDIGVGVFAKHEIKRGEIIFSERPLLVAPNWVTPLESRISDQQWKEAMLSEQEKSLEVAFQRMNENDKAIFMALANSHTTDGSGPLYGRMRTNGFGIKKKLSSDADGRFGYSAVCAIGSRLNHSCLCNVMHFFDLSSFSVLFIALQNIKAGDQLYHSYCSETRTKAERQADLAPYGFSCNCLACVNATPASDNLRKTFGNRAARLDGRKNGAELLADLVAARDLEAEMIAEGLDTTVDFFTVQCVLHMANGKLGIISEQMKYRERVKEYCKAQVYNRPELGVMLNL